MSNKSIAERRKHAGKANHATAPTIAGGRIDYDSFMAFGHTQAMAALDRLAWILQHRVCGVDIGEWPLAFEDSNQAARFLRDLSKESNSCRRVNDSMNQLFVRSNFFGNFGIFYGPCATADSAAKYLRTLKKDFYDKGRTFSEFEQRTNVERYAT